MAKKKIPKWATTVTPFSKFLALSMLVIFPICGFYLGRYYERTVSLNHQITPPTTPTTAITTSKIIPTYSPQKPTISPDKLIVIRPEDKIDNLPALTRTITDAKTVKKLYDEIYSLPYPPSGIVNCPMEIFVRYILIFSLHGNTVFHGTLSPTGCRYILVEEEKSRWALSKQGDQFIQDLQDALVLSSVEFYGSQNGRSNRN